MEVYVLSEIFKNIIDDLHFGSHLRVCIRKPPLFKNDVCILDHNNSKLNDTVCIVAQKNLFQRSCSGVGDKHMSCKPGVAGSMLLDKTTIG